MNNSKSALFTLLMSLFLYTGTAAAANHPVQFALGTSSSSVKGIVKGSNDEDYVLRASGGQTMTVKLSAKSTLIYFNVLNKVSDETLYVGSSVGKNAWSGSLPTDGEYIIRVYTMGKGKDAGHSTPFSLSISIK
jgi:hypothetical protein